MRVLFCLNLCLLFLFSFASMAVVFLNVQCTLGQTNTSWTSPYLTLSLKRSEMQKFVFFITNRKSTWLTMGGKQNHLGSAHRQSLSPLPDRYRDGKQRKHNSARRKHQSTENLSFEVFKQEVFWAPILDISIYCIPGVFVCICQEMDLFFTLPQLHLQSILEQRSIRNWIFITPTYICAHIVSWSVVCFQLIKKGEEKYIKWMKEKQAN